MANCDQCDLPISICNELAAWRQAVRFLQHGQLEQAKLCIDDANFFHQQYEQTRIEEFTP